MPAPGERRRVGPFHVSPLCLGTNVFGWTAGERDSLRVLDAYAAAGGNFLDSADSYSHWADGHRGGESEAILGRWLARPGNRERVLVATKVGRKPGRDSLAAATMALALDESLARLRTDVVDLWFLHRDDRETPLEETAVALAAAHRAGKVRAFGISNFEPARIDALVRACAAVGAPPPVALQPHYNLIDRDCYEGELRACAVRHRLAAIPYFGLARGFLTGKYRGGGELPDSPRTPHAAAYLGERRGHEVLSALDAVAAAHRAPVAAIALAWLAAQPTVAAPLASARSEAQLRELLPVASLRLSPAEEALLSRAA